MYSVASGMSHPRSGPKRSKIGLVVVAVRARVQLHHQAVFHAHPGHLDQHVPGEQPHILGRGAARQGPLEHGLGLGRRQLGCERCLRRVIGGAGTHLLEELPPLLEGLDVTCVGRDVEARLRGQAPDLRRPARMPQVDGQVGPERGSYGAGPARSPDLVVPLERVGRRVGRAEHLDAEPVEQGAGPKLGPSQTGVDVVVDPHGRRGGQRLVDPEHAFELLRQPGAARRSAKQVKVVAEDLPDPPRIGFGPPAVDARDSQRLHRHALRVQHADDVVIRDHDQRRRIGKPLVEREQPGFDVPVRAHQRVSRGQLIQLACDVAHGGDRAEKAIGVQHSGEYIEVPGARCPSAACGAWC